MPTAVRRRFSRKRAALTAVFEQPWWTVALEWDAKPLALREIAAAWTEAVSAAHPEVTYSPQDASDIIRLAKAEALEQASTSDPKPQGAPA